MARKKQISCFLVFFRAVNALAAIISLIILSSFSTKYDYAYNMSQLHD